MTGKGFERYKWKANRIKRTGFSPSSNRLFRSEKNFLTLFYKPVKVRQGFSCELSIFSSFVSHYNAKISLTSRGIIRDNTRLNTEKTLDRQWRSLIG